MIVMGILPSDHSRRDPSAAMRHRASARQTWLKELSSDIVARFVLPVPPTSATTNKYRRRPRRRLDSQNEQHIDPTHVAQELAKESAVHRDLLGLPLPITAAAAAAAAERQPRPLQLCRCHELVHAWFAHAVESWPNARFVAKTEDDIFISLPALRFELARLPHADGLLWWGLMAWTGNGDLDHLRDGCWGGQFEDDPTLSAKAVHATLSKERGCPVGARPMAPAPTHEIEVRGISLAHSIAACDFPRRWLAAMGDGKCPNDCAAVQGLWLTRCVSRNVTLAHATWTKVHSNSLDSGWRPFAPPSNLTVVLDMNLGDKKLRELAKELGFVEPWKRVSAIMGTDAPSAFPPLLYRYDPTRQSGSPVLMAALNPRVAELHFHTCRWGGCHPSRGEQAVGWPAWVASSATPSTAALGLSE